MSEVSSRETKVGILLTLAIGIVCTLIILLGEMPELWKSTYILTVEFPDASGLSNGADVNLCGAIIGKVVAEPHMVPHSDLADVQVRIDRDVVVRRDARWMVNNSGLLGDAFVEVRPRLPSLGEEKSSVLANGDTVVGVSGVDLSTLIKASLPLIYKANHAAGQLDEIVTRLNNGVLTQATCADIRKTVRTLPRLIDDGHAVVQNANDLVDGLKSGQGALGELLYDPEVKSNLGALGPNFESFRWCVSDESGFTSGR
jgi:phospholipid/cholesterol/gamma-HCH transport system substrate-binding protein